MAEEHNKSEQVEVSDRGLFDFMGKKKEERPQEEVLVTGVENLQIDEARKVEEKKEEGKKEGLLDKLHRSSSSSSSSDEEAAEGPDGEKRKKKKKGLKEKIEEKLHGDKKEAEEEKTATAVATEQGVVVAPAAPPAEDTNIAVEKVDETVKVEGEEEVKKKGFLEKIKEKLPGHHSPKKEGEEQVVVVKESVSSSVSEGGEEQGQGQDGKEKKGILGKIMEKLPGYGHKEESVDTPAAGH